MKSAYITPETTVISAHTQGALMAGSDPRKGRFYRKGFNTGAPTIFEDVPEGGFKLTVGGQSSSHTGNRSKENNIWSNWDE